MKTVFEITKNCMNAGLSDPGDQARDVLDNLAAHMRNRPEVRELLENVASGAVESAIVSIAPKRKEKQ